MNEPRWISEKVVKAIHAQLIAEHGGETGVLNPGQLSSTLARPKNLFAYVDNPSLFDLAASYGYGLAKNHCFVDGNKRIAVAIVDVFLQLNGLELVVDEVEVVVYFLELAGSLRTPEEDQADLSVWIEKNSRPLN